MLVLLCVRVAHGHEWRNEAVFTVIKAKPHQSTNQPPNIFTGKGGSPQWLLAWFTTRQMVGHRASLCFITLLLTISTRQGLETVQIY